MNKRKLITLLGGGRKVPTVPWYLAAGLNPDSIFGVYQFIGAENEAEAISNRHNAGTNDLSKNGTPTFDTLTGIMCSGTNFLKTGWLPSKTDFFAMLRFSTEETANYYPIFGLIDGNAQFYYLNDPAGNSIKAYLGASNNASAPFMQTGVIASCAKANYRDGVVFGPAPSARSAKSVYEAYLGNVNNGGTPYASLPKKLYLEAAILCEGSPTNQMIADLSTKMAALPTTAFYFGGEYAGHVCSTNQRYSVMGDSISTSSFTGYWANLAPENLNSGWGYVRVLNHSVSGYKISDNMLAQAGTIAGDDPDFVIVWLGTNDTASSDYAGLLTQYESAIDIYLANGPRLMAENIFCMGILNKTNPGNRTQINTQVIRQAAINKGCTYIDTDGWITAPDDLSDGLHPTLAGHNKIIARMKVEIP